METVVGPGCCQLIPFSRNFQKLNHINLSFFHLTACLNLMKPKQMQLFMVCLASGTSQQISIKFARNCLSASSYFYPNWLIRFETGKDLLDWSNFRFGLFKSSPSKQRVLLWLRFKHATQNAEHLQKSHLYETTRTSDNLVIKKCFEVPYPKLIQPAF